MKTSCSKLSIFFAAGILFSTIVEQHASIPEHCLNPEAGVDNLINIGSRYFYISRGSIHEIKIDNNDSDGLLSIRADPISRDVQAVFPGIDITGRCHITAFKIGNRLTLSVFKGNDDSRTNYFTYESTQNQEEQLFSLVQVGDSMTILNYTLGLNDRSVVSVNDGNGVIWFHGCQQRFLDLRDLNYHEFGDISQDGLSCIVPPSLTEITLGRNKKRILRFLGIHYLVDGSEVNETGFLSSDVKNYYLASHVKGCPQDFCMEGKVDTIIKTHKATIFGRKGYIVFREGYYWITSSPPHLSYPINEDALPISKHLLRSPVTSAFVIFKSLIVISENIYIKLCIENTSHSKIAQHQVSSLFPGINVGSESTKFSRIRSVVVLDPKKVYVFHGCCFYSIFECRESESGNDICEARTLFLPITDFPGLPADMDTLYWDEFNRVVYAHKDNWIFTIPEVAFFSRSTINMRHYLSNYLDYRGDSPCTKSHNISNVFGYIPRHIVKDYHNENLTFNEAYIVAMRHLDPLKELHYSDIPSVEDYLTKNSQNNAQIVAILICFLFILVGLTIIYIFLLMERKRRERKRSSSTECDPEVTKGFLHQVLVQRQSPE